MATEDELAAMMDDMSEESTDGAGLLNDEDQTQALPDEPIPESKDEEKEKEDEDDDDDIEYSLEEELRVCVADDIKEYQEHFDNHSSLMQSGEDDKAKVNAAVKVMAYAPILLCKDPDNKQLLATYNVACKIAEESYEVQPAGEMLLSVKEAILEHEEHLKEIRIRYRTEIEEAFAWANLAKQAALCNTKDRNALDAIWFFLNKVFPGALLETEDIKPLLGILKENHYSLHEDRPVSNAPTSSAMHPYIIRFLNDLSGLKDRKENIWHVLDVGLDILLHTNVDLEKEGFGKIHQETSEYFYKHERIEKYGVDYFNKKLKQQIKLYKQQDEKNKKAASESSATTPPAKPAKKAVAKKPAAPAAPKSKLSTGKAKKPEKKPSQQQQQQTSAPPKKAEEKASDFDDDDEEMQVEVEAEKKEGDKEKPVEEEEEEKQEEEDDEDMDTKTPFDSPYLNKSMIYDFENALKEAKKDKDFALDYLPIATKLPEDMRLGVCLNMVYHKASPLSIVLPGDTAGIPHCVGVLNYYARQKMESGKRHSSLCLSRPSPLSPTPAFKTVKTKHADSPVLAFTKASAASPNFNSYHRYARTCGFFNRNEAVDVWKARVGEVDWAINNDVFSILPVPVQARFAMFYEGKNIVVKPHLHEEAALTTKKDFKALKYNINFNGHFEKESVVCDGLNLSTPNVVKSMFCCQGCNLSVNLTVAQDPSSLYKEVPAIDSKRRQVCDSRMQNFKAAMPPRTPFVCLSCICPLSNKIVGRNDPYLIAAHPKSGYDRRIHVLEFQKHLKLLEKLRCKRTADVLRKAASDGNKLLVGCSLYAEDRATKDGFRPCGITGCMIEAIPVTKVQWKSKEKFNIEHYLSLKTNKDKADAGYSVLLTCIACRRRIHDTSFPPFYEDKRNINDHITKIPAENNGAGATWYFTCTDKCRELVSVNSPSTVRKAAEYLLRNKLVKNQRVATLDADSEEKLAKSKAKAAAKASAATEKALSASTSGQKNPSSKQASSSNTSKKASSSSSSSSTASTASGTSKSFTLRHTNFQVRLPDALRDLKQTDLFIEGKKKGSIEGYTQKGAGLAIYDHLYQISKLMPIAFPVEEAQAKPTEKEKPVKANKAPPKKTDTDTDQQPTKKAKK